MHYLRKTKYTCIDMRANLLINLEYLNGFTNSKLYYVYVYVNIVKSKSFVLVYQLM